MKCPWPLLDQLQVVVRIQLLFIIAKDPWVRDQPHAAMKEVDPANVHVDLDLYPNIPAGDGIAVFIHPKPWHRGPFCRGCTGRKGPSIGQAATAGRHNQRIPGGRTFLIVSRKCPVS